MRKGKLAAQVAHASMKVFFDRGTAGRDSTTNSNVIIIDAVTDDMLSWFEGSFGKVVLGVRSEEDLVAIYQQALAAGLPAALIEDLGHTEFHGQVTKTAVAIGPADAVIIDPITKDGTISTRLL